MAKNKYWFKRRRFGWGWTPVTIEGWLVLVVYIFAMLALATVWLGDVPEDEFTPEVAGFLASIAVLTAILIAFTMQHAPKARWRWGKKETDNPDEDF